MEFVKKEGIILGIIKLKNLYEKNNLNSEIESAIDLLKSLNVTFGDIDNFDEKNLDQIIVYLVDKDLCNIENIIVLMRYYRMIDRSDLYIHLTRYTGMLDVIENILKRLKSLVNKELYLKITEGYNPPFLGVSPRNLPFYVDDLMKRLDQFLSDELVKKVLTGNNHDVSDKSQLREKVEYENANDLKTYLEERHARKVKELEEHLAMNKVWFEQTITKEVVDFVKSNQEVLSAKLKDEKLYITKIPYDTVNYLNATDEVSRKYFGCHCPFAREAIKNDNPKLDERFCYCSAGFAKFPFEVILGQPLKIKTLETILGGSDICRFEIDLKDVSYKK